MLQLGEKRNDFNRIQSDTSKFDAERKMIEAQRKKLNQDLANEYKEQMQSKRKNQVSSTKLNKDKELIEEKTKFAQYQKA